MWALPAIAAQALILASITPAGEGGDVLIEGVPHVRQRPDFCGEACTEMYLRKLGSTITQDEVFDRAGVDPALGRGAYTREMVAALKSLGFDVGQVWHDVDASGPGRDLEALWREALSDLRAGVPSIVCMRTSDGPEGTEHFRLLLGWRAAGDEVVYHEPAEDGGAYRHMKRADFMRLWPLKYDEKTWTVVRMRLDPASMARDAKPAAGRRLADYAQHVMKLGPMLAGRGMTVVIEPPFVVVGDGRPDDVRASARGTVKWAVALLRKDLFRKEPGGIITIWLFKDAASYRRHCREIFGTTPTTPYGYYSEEHDALVMNIATGGGTLVHEIVHPFVHADFPEAPPWLNEGLGSLYEQCGERDGHIRGFTNWRLAGLQEAIGEGSLKSFRTLTSLSSSEFYGGDSGTHYAQARYLLYYLQEKGLLFEFYRKFRDNRESDPTGYDTLQAVLGVEDMKEFQKAWEKFVMALTFP